MKVRNRLLNFGDYIIYQNDDWFAFSLDSVLLANFVTLKYRDKSIIDFCSGNAPVPMLMSFRTKAHIVGIEIQKDVYDLGMESIKENKMEEQIELINRDVLETGELFSAESFDVVTCNPPYFKYKEDSLINENKIKSVARHEVMINLDNIVDRASYLLKNGGTFAMVHRPERLMEIISLFKKYNIEPKKMRFVYPKFGLDANILLIEGIKNGKTGLKVMAPLFSHNNDGSYTEEVRRMFGGNEDVAE